MVRELPDKIQWHPAFCAAAELELRENIKELDLIPEYNLQGTYSHRSFGDKRERTGKDIEDIKEFLKNSGKVTDVRERSNIEAVLQVSVNANFELYEQVRRDSVMCESLRELMKEEIEIDKKKSREQGMAQGMAQVILNMYNNGFTLEQITLATSKSKKDIEDVIAGKNPVLETV